jgi:hypothetical protein
MADTTGLFEIKGYSGGSILNVLYKNLTINGLHSNRRGCGIMIYTTSSRDTIFNCRISNFKYGIFCGYLKNADGTYHYIENNAIYDCIYGFYLTGTGTANRYFTLRNNVVLSTLGGVGYFNNGVPAIYDKLFNCADSDNSISTLGTINSNCVTGVLNSDFVSILESSSDFLKIHSLSKLFNTGSHTLSPSNTVDFLGLLRPSYSGHYSIGVHEPFSAFCTLKANVCGHIYTKTKEISL